MLNTTVKPSLLKAALRRRAKTNKITPRHYNQSVENFILILADRCQPCSYGHHIAKKIIYDNKFLLPASTKMERGDIDVAGKLFLESKMATLHTDQPLFRFTHIRPWQNLTYYLFILVNPEENYHTDYYVVKKDFLFNHPEVTMNPMNGSKKLNESNKYVDMAINLKKDLAYRILDEGNMLRGTSYNDLQAFINYINADGKSRTELRKKYVAKIQGKKYVAIPKVKVKRKKTVKSKKSKLVKISFNYNGFKIDGVNNEETMIKLVKIIGAHNLTNFIRKSHLSITKTAHRNVKLGQYYFNPEFTYDETVKLVNSINSKTTNKLILIEE